MLRPARKSISQFCFIFFAILLISGCFTPISRSFFGLPLHQNVVVGEPLAPSLQLPAALTSVLKWQADRPEAVRVVYPDQGPVLQEAGEYRVSLKLFGFIPLKHLTVTAVPELKVVPGGQSIGVLLHSEGVQVIGQAPFRMLGQEFSPAYRAGIRDGDIILSINGRRVRSEDQVQEIVNEFGSGGHTLEVRVRRNGRELRLGVTPGFCESTGRYRMGLLVRNSTAGVGTLTFFEPQSRSYGALGHVIADGRTARRAEFTEGKIVETEIQGLRPGVRGRPGEKVGVFSGDSTLSGSIDLNTIYGIFGTLGSGLVNPFFEEPLPIALLHHVRPGPAEMLTVIRGQEIERFAILIEGIRPEAVNDGKGLMVRIADERLLNQSGGIIQGMSGSPIIQDGRLVGAITHVFINNPARGYGVPVEWMLRECGLLQALEEQRRPAGLRKTG